MRSRAITMVALCVTCVVGALAAIPGPGNEVPQPASGQSALMQALAQAPDAVAAWKSAQARQRQQEKQRQQENQHKISRKPRTPGPGWMNNELGAFGIKVFAGS